MGTVKIYIFIYVFFNLCRQKLKLNAQACHTYTMCARVSLLVHGFSFTLAQTDLSWISTVTFLSTHVNR